MTEGNEHRDVRGDVRAQIREFLSTRRARISPEQAGLPVYGGGRRRGPGPRRARGARPGGRWPRAQPRAPRPPRRARISPEQAGLPVYGGDRRRVPGLRRSEVASLAGISPEYMTKLERGNATAVSERESARRAPVGQ